MFTQLDDDGQEFMVEYVSWSNNKMEVKYNSYERECLAIVWAIFFHFGAIFMVSPFTLVIDHQPLKFFIELDQFIRKFAKWAWLILHECDFDIVHQVGRVNQDVDGLNQTLSSNEENTIGAQWNGEVDLEVVLRWHASAYLCALLGCFGTLQMDMNMGHSHDVDIES